MNNGYKTVHKCEEDGVRHVVLHNPHTGGVITTSTQMIPIYCPHPHQT